MTSMEPFVPHPDDEEQVAAADPGAGGPAPAPGFGTEGEEPGTAAPDAPGGDGTRDPGDVDTPFRTPAAPER